MSNYNLKWKNKFSGEEGYVKIVRKSKGYFENTFNQSEAKKYRKPSEYKADMSFLESIGETEQNDFEIIEF